MPQQPQAFDPNEFANTPTFDPNEFAKPVQAPASPSFYDQVASYIPSPVKSAWDSLWNPLSDLPSRVMKPISEAEYRYGESGNGLLNKLAMYGGAFDEAVGNTLTSMTSPGQLGAMALTEGASQLGAAAPAITRMAPAATEMVPDAIGAMNTVGRGLGAATAAHGITTVANPNLSPVERAFGVLETATGALSAKAPHPMSELPGKIPQTHESATVKAAPEPVAEMPIREPIKQTIPYEPPSMKNASKVARQEAALKNLEDKGIAKPEFDPNTLQGLKKTQEFVDPHTGEITTEPKPGHVPLVEEPNAPTEIKDSTVKEAQANVNEKEYKTGKPAVDTGPIVPENAGVKTVGEQITQRLSDRLNKVTEHPEAAPEEVSALTNDAEETLANVPKKDQPGILRQILGANKALLTAWDLSAPGRQGKAFMMNKAWWTSLDDMVKAWGSKAAAETIHQSIIDHPSGYFKPTIKVTSQWGKTRMISYAEKMGLELASHEEMFNTPGGQAFSKYSGIDKANRAHTAFLNKLRSDQFVSMMQEAEKAGLDKRSTNVRAKAYAKFINEATGRADVKGQLKLGKAVLDVNDALFAPKNLVGQIKTWNNVLNPIKYANYDPVLRKQALKSLFAIAGLGLGVGEMAKQGGLQVNNDPTSADFRKIKIGDNRIDLFGGYGQFPVAAAKLLMGESTSTSEKNYGKTTDLTAGKYGQQTRASVAERFFTNRLSPLPSFVWAWMNNREFDGQPFDAKRAVFERVFPIALKDIMDIAKEDPALAALTAPTTILGLTGTQTYTGR